MNKNEVAAQILDGGADWIETHGWRQDGLVGPNGGVCAVKAMCHASKPWTDFAYALETLKSHLDLPANVDVAIWNDTPGRTKYEVIDAMRGAAKELRNRENE
jgi:hypothetical protein